MFEGKIHYAVSYPNSTEISRIDPSGKIEKFVTLPDAVRAMGVGGDVLYALTTDAIVRIAKDASFSKIPLLAPFAPLEPYEDRCSVLGAAGFAYFTINGRNGVFRVNVEKGGSPEQIEANLAEVHLAAIDAQRVYVVSDRTPFALPHDALEPVALPKPADTVGLTLGGDSLYTWTLDGIFEAPLAGGASPVAIFDDSLLPEWCLNEYFGRCGVMTFHGQQLYMLVNTGQEPYYITAKIVRMPLDGAPIEVLAEPPAGLVEAPVGVFNLQIAVDDAALYYHLTTGLARLAYTN
jgi:hypothetical protein